MADEEATEQDASLQETQATTTRSRARVIAVLVAVAIVLGLVASVMTASYLRLRNDRNSADAERTRVATTATQVVEAMFRVDVGSDNKAESSVIHTLGTAPLIEQYEQVIPTTRDLMKSLDVTSQHAEIVDNGVFVGDVGANEARVVVIMDNVVVGKAAKVVPNFYLRIDLVKLDGTWKVDNITNLNVSLASAQQQAGNSSSSSSS